MHDAVVLERGRVAYQGPSERLIADPALLDRWLGVAAH
jgi:ABC-type branched-subunit amino acid transport system ATPase component